MEPAKSLPAEMRYADIAVGLRASFTHQVTHSDIVRFAELSGDRNPLHMDQSYASTTEVRGRIAHGMFVGALFSRLVGMHLPGRSALYLSQSIDFVRPVRPGDRLEIAGEIVSKHDAMRTVVIRTEARLGDHIAVRGRAVVKLLR